MTNMTNILNLFKFIESKKPEYKVPFKDLLVKFLYAPESLTKDDLTVKGHLGLSGTKISSLPDNLSVGGTLDLFNTDISSLPNNLNVGGDLNLSNTPISTKYSRDKIRKMIQDKGGNIKGKLYA